MFQKEPELCTSTQQLQLGFVRLGKIMAHKSALHFPPFCKMKAKEVLPRTFGELIKKPSEEEHCVVGVVDEVSANSRAALPVCGATPHT